MHIFNRHYRLGVLLTESHFPLRWKSDTLYRLVAY